MRNVGAVFGLALVVASIALRAWQVIDSPFAVAVLAAGIGFLVLTVPQLTEGIGSIGFGPFSAKMKEELLYTVIDTAVDRAPGVMMEPEPADPGEGQGATGGPGRAEWAQMVRQAKTPREVADILVSAMDSERWARGQYLVRRNARRTQSADEAR